MYADEILKQKATEEKKPLVELSITQQAMATCFLVGSGMGAAYAFFYQKKYWKCMLIGGISAAAVAGVISFKR